MPSARRILPLGLLGVGVLLLGASGLCYQSTGGGLGCHVMLAIATLSCVGAFALAWQKGPPR